MPAEPVQAPRKTRLKFDDCGVVGSQLFSDAQCLTERGFGLFIWLAHIPSQDADVVVNARQIVLK